MNTEKIYEFENVNSKLVMDIVDGKVEENSNVQQSSSTHSSTQKWILKPFSLGGNYYYIHSLNNTNFVLKSNSGANGGNICIVPFSTTDSSMLFKFSKNPDGSYMIMSRASKENCYVEVANANTKSGANIQQWEATNHSCQNWKLNEVNEDNTSLSLSIVKTEVYKNDDCMHTVVYVK